MDRYHNGVGKPGSNGVQGLFRRSQKILPRLEQQRLVYLVLLHESFSCIGARLCNSDHLASVWVVYCIVSVGLGYIVNIHRQGKGVFQPTWPRCPHPITARVTAGLSRTSTGRGSGSVLVGTSFALTDFRHLLLDRKEDIVRFTEADYSEGVHFGRL